MRPDLDEIRARAEASTPGPWLIWNGFGPNVHGEMGAERIGPELSHARALFAGSDPGRGTITGLPADMEFVAHAREDIPALLAYVAALESERDELLVFRTQGHAEECAGMDENEGRCGCGWLQGEGAHRVLVEWRTRAERLESERDRLRAALEPFAKMRRAAKGKTLMVGIGLRDPNAPVYSVNPDGTMYELTAGDFDRAVAALEGTNG